MIEAIDVYHYDLNKLLDIWERSVIETHNFISKEMIESMRPEVLRGFASMDKVLIYTRNDAVTGFMGILNKKIEMLFLDPYYRGMGIGAILVNAALNDYDVRFVDVNEQNFQAVGFYNSMGFVTVSRSDFDDAGRPFPILHLEYQRKNV
ncbi:GNAT family N-acetyltransferase [Erysipelothrix sp. HDW6C]|uniref:GNAT family N-acetyltransferase n=1 Tax=Erysipelothrix sp. HDW6C TaxID=2714930 RepID=UPI0014095601|nr:GNAT family N-acetyltransferase [Erysipelothrix sp. HDW6C]QIK69856.1 GNAT family N-acetyltransferase [Erysipelothrix sp. HDW6C]